MRRPGVHGRSSLYRAARGGLALLIALAMTTGLALAHANLVRSDPPAGASLPTAPARVQLWFSEELEPSFSEAVVYDVNQQRVDRGDSHVDPNDPRSLIVSLKPSLPHGTYAIAWKTQSRVDGHVTRGIVPFGVGVTASVPAASAVAATSQPVSGTPLEMALRWLVLLSSAALTGTFAFWILQGRVGRSEGTDGSERDQEDGRGSRRLDREPPPEPGGGATTGLLTRSAPPTARTIEVAPLQQRLAWLAWALFVAGNLVFVVYEASVSVGVSLEQAIGAAAIQFAVETQYGRFWIARVTLGLLLGAILAVRGRRKLGAAHHLDLLGVAVGVPLLLSISLSSHSAALGSLSPLGIAVDWLHLAAVAVWVGGLIQLAGALPAILRLGNATARAEALGALVPRFAVVAGIALAILGATGLTEAFLHVGTLDNLLNSGYGQALLAKILAILPLVTIAAINHFVVRPVFLRARANRSPAAIRQVLSTSGLFRWTVALEILFAVAVIAATGVMTSLSPPRQIASSEAGPLTLSATAGDLSATFTLTPGRPGPNRYLVEVRDAQGILVPDVQQVALRFTYLDSDLGVSEAVLSPSGSGRFEGQSSDLAVTGRWQTEIIIRRPGHDDVSAVVGYLVTTEGARSLESVPLELGWRFYVGLAIVVAGLASLARGAVLRPRDVRRGLAVMLCGLCLGGIGAGLALRDVQQAEAQAAAATQALAHPATAQSIANGAIVFQQNCAICHGADARGDGPMAPTLNPRPSNLIVHVPQHPDADLENWIANGFPGSAMPAFKDTLTEQQRWDVLNYLKAQVRSANGPTAGASGSAGSTAAATPAPPAPSASAPRPTTAPESAVTPAPSRVQPAALSLQTIDRSSRRLALGDLTADVEITPRIYEPAQIDLRFADRDGRPVTDIRRVDLQVAMEGMNHGARGIEASPVGPGHYHAAALLLAMEGRWWLAVRVERTGGEVSSSLLSFDVPSETPNGPVSALYQRATEPVQVEDVAVYPDGITPPGIQVRSGHPVRLEIMYVDHPHCGSTVAFGDLDARATVSAEGLAELSFTPTRTGTLWLACTASELQIQWMHQ